MGFRYVVLGAGRQGTAAAYDLARFGEADAVVVADQSPGRAAEAAGRVARLTGSRAVETAALDVADTPAVVALLRGADAVVSAVPWFLNVPLARAAVEARANFCDLGGHTGTVLEELALHERAAAAGMAIVPDCGVMPGMGNTLAVYGMERLAGLGARPSGVKVYVGGLPRKPRPPLNYKLVFHLEGMLELYLEPAEILRDGRRITVEPMSEPEAIDFGPPLGPCEALITAGGASTCPRTFEGTLDSYEEKTVRYPGHFAQFRALQALGLLDKEPVKVGDAMVSPLALTCKVLTPLIDFPEDDDLLVLRVICDGEAAGAPVSAVYDLMDFSDESTGFTAMERTTGFSVAIVAGLLARRAIAPGARPLEVAVPAGPFIEQALRRGFALTETLKAPMGTR